MDALDIVELKRDLNTKLKKGTKGVILEVYDNGKAFEVEFPKKDGTNITFEGQTTFTIPKENLILKKKHHSI